MVEWEPLEEGMKLFLQCSTVQEALELREPQLLLMSLIPDCIQYH